MPTTRLCSKCFRKFIRREDAAPPEDSVAEDTLCPHCGGAWLNTSNCALDRETALQFFQDFPSGKHEWEMTVEEKQKFIGGICLLETLVDSFDRELFCAAASAVGYGISGGVFLQLVLVLRQNKNFLLYGLSDLGWSDSSPEYIRYALMLCSESLDFLGDPSARIRAAAINRIAIEEIIPGQKDPDGQELCMKAAKKLDDEFASLQLDYLFKKFGGSFFFTPSFRYPETKAFGARERMCWLLVILSICMPVTGFAGYWLGKRKENSLIPNMEWWLAGLGMVTALVTALHSYSQWVREEKTQKAKGRLKRDWPVPKSLKKALKRRSEDEIKIAILLGHANGLEAIVFLIGGPELTYVSPDGQTKVVAGAKDIIHELSEALRDASEFMLPCHRIVYPSPGNVTINIRYPGLGFLVIEERIEAMQDGNTLVGEVFAVALPKLMALVKTSYHSPEPPPLRRGALADG
ncbi:MAG TPA: hypothetical protein PKY10_01740 [Lentisphaeria bacterium]|nr:hypothetical protein [Lentisphaeria bacterium]